MLYIGEKSAVSVGESKEVSILKTRPTLEAPPATAQLKTGKNLPRSKNACASGLAAWAGPIEDAGLVSRCVGGEAAFGPKVSNLNVMAVVLWFIRW
jgi:hypothetical protein